MPQVEFTKRDLENLLGFEVEETQLETYFMPAKSELDAYDESTGIIKLKGTDTNRPDLWGVEGIVRELKAHLGLEKGLPKYKFGKSDYVVDVSGLTKIRPHAAYAIVRNIEVTEDLLISLINMQEKIANSFGNRRKDLGAGLFDLDKINGKHLRYYAADTNTKFAPLGTEEKMTLKDVLTKHKKGIEFAHLLKDFDKYPLLIDEKNEVLTMPPIINSNHSGKVAENTRNLFLEVTGFGQEKCDVVLMIFAMALVDRGATVESVTVNYLDERKTITTLDTTANEMVIDKIKILEFLGENLTDSQISEFLERKHYDVRILNSKVTVKYPKYRQDILHPVDVIEDLIIEYGYNTLAPKKLNFATVGKLLPTTEFNNIVRESAIGLGLQEVLTFTLTSIKKQYDTLGIEKKNRNYIEIANPMSESIAIFRERLLPEHLELLSKNQHNTYPQDIFELGKIAYVTKDSKGKDVHKEENHLIVTLCHNEVNYTEAKQRLDAILKAIGATEIHYEAKDFVMCIPRRSAQVTYKLGSKVLQGHIGEIHPQVLINFGIIMPVVGFEINVDKYD